MESGSSPTSVKRRLDLNSLNNNGGSQTALGMGCAGSTFADDKENKYSNNNNRCSSSPVARES
jgi:hypothetical protein